MWTAQNSRLTSFLAKLLKEQRVGGLVHQFLRTEELDGTRIDVARFERPLLAVLDEVLEGSALEVNQRLADNGLVLARTAFHVHHHGDGHTTGDPILSLAAQMGDGRHVASSTDEDEVGCVVTQRVAVISIKVGREGATTLVAEEVMLSLELDGIDQASLDAHLKDVGNHAAEQTLTLDL